MKFLIAASLNLLHSLCRKSCPLGILEYFVMPKQSLKLPKILEIEIQEAQLANPVIHISVLFSCG